MSATGKDGGWAWIVCAGAFVALLLETGMVKALGLLLPALREEFSSSTWLIGLIIAFVPGFGAVTCKPNHIIVHACLCVKYMVICSVQSGVKRKRKRMGNKSRYILFLCYLVTID